MDAGETMIMTGTIMTTTTDHYALMRVEVALS